MNDSKAIFVGGIHGVGKTEVCELLSKEFKLEILSASSLLNWDSSSQNKINKTVSNIDKNQHRLIELLNSNSITEKVYILDGHFCLLNAKFQIECIDFSIFKEINPLIIIVKTENPEIIKKRLFQRDAINYDIDLILKIQNEEIRYAYNISKKLNIPFFTLNSEKIKTLVGTLTPIIADYIK